MHESAVRPTGHERTFGAEEIIVSATDPRGRITYANDVFARVSGYTEDELVGRPHNLIRHPDMPRAVFAHLWEVIASGSEIFAYVLNLASDGAHYWVLAHVTPTVDASGRLVGYHSNRRSPSRTAVTQVQVVYDELRAIERRYPGSPEGLAASTARLGELLAGRGQSYDRFVWSLIRGEGLS